MVEIQNLIKRYGETKAVDIPSVNFQKDCMIGIVGNNGAGKTTLFRLTLDLAKPDSGGITIDGIGVSQSEDWKQNTGAFIDSSFLIDYLTAEEYFLFVGKMYHLTRQETLERVGRYERLMNGEIMGEKKYIRNYSAGNKQKIGIIAAMLHNPGLLILDEPFNFLDPTSQSVMCHLLKEYQKENHATVLISSHNLEHTVDISDRIILMEKGEIINDLDNTSGNAREILEHYFDAGTGE